MNLTPGMKQYMDVKQQYPDCIVLFRMGDFYETFFDDAQAISKILNITLTARGKGDSRAPLAGIPYHALDRHLSKLMQAGKKVAICEQTEDPKKAKGLVKRDVVRVLTPGTVIEDSILNETTNNFIASVFTDGDTTGIAFVDISTGLFLYTETTNIEDVKQELLRKKTAELLVPVGSQFESFCAQQGIYCNQLSVEQFFLPRAMQSLQQHFSESPDSLGFKGHEYATCAAGALVTYLHETQKQGLQYLKKPKKYAVSEYMIVDGATVRNLELLKNIRDGSATGSLLSILDDTKTPMGGRLVKFWITHPLKDIAAINGRLAVVKDFVSNGIVLEDTREILSAIIDIERLVSKISYRFNSPKDLVQLKHSLRQLDALKDVLQTCTAPRLQHVLAFPDVSKLISAIDDAIAEESKGSEIVRSGEGYSSGGSGRREIGIIKSGYDSELDALYSLKFDTTKNIKDMEKTEQEKTGIPIKIGYNSVFGYYIEVTNKFKDAVPQHYIRKQTLVNAERFITDELKVFEEQLLHAEEKIVARETEILDGVIKIVLEHTEKLQAISERIAELDVLASFATIAQNQNYMCPEITSKYELVLTESRHPVLEVLEKNFIPNDCTLNEDGFLMLITGPNMAGKSTFMRQVALIVLLAHCGSFVPATAAKIGITDQIFSRVGAYDDLTMGQSTFMVEMLETANILNTATNRSFIILDEIGRGTSTFDGVAIAWSVAEHIAQKIGAKTLFATHYHVMTKLAQHKGIVNYNVAVAEDGNKIVFLHKIQKGGTDKSYGVHVAELAGLPSEVIQNAKKVQVQLEAENKLSEKLVVESKKDGMHIANQKRVDEY